MILTKSSKHSDYCVAGIDCATGKFIRLISNNDDKEGALSGDHMHYDNDTEVQILDMARVDKNEKLVRANIVFSLPDGDWSEEHGKYYKFAAKIFKVA